MLTSYGALLARSPAAFRPHVAVLALYCSVSVLGCADDPTARPETDSETDPTETTERDAGRSPDSGKTRAEADASKSAPPISKPVNTGTGPEACAKAELTTTRVVPSVWLMIDGSGSMVAGLSGLTGPSRWTVVRDALMTPTSGLVARLEGSIAFGLLIYDGGLSPPGLVSPLCPRVIAVEPALHNFAAIDMAYPAAPTGASTPTHYALVDLSKRIAQGKQSGKTNPTYVVLATDGKPNLCDFHDGIPASAATEQEAIDTVGMLASEGTKTFAVSLAGDDAALQEHLNSLAKAGNTGKNAFSPATQDALVSSLTEIIGGTASCDVHVEGTIVPGRECAGDVTLDGKPLVCNDPDGYRIKDDRQTLELLGAACSALQGQPSSSLSASFACDDVVLI